MRPKRKHRLYRNISRLVLLSIIFTASAFCADAAFRVVESSAKRLVVEYKPEITEYREIQCAGGETSFLPIIKGSVIEDGTPGEPSRLVYQAVVNVPSPDGFSFEYDIEKYDFKSGLIAPYPSYEGEIGDFSYVIDEKEYAETLSLSRDFGLAKKFAPKLEYAGIARDRHIARLTIPLTQYFEKFSGFYALGKIRINVEFDASKAVNAAENPSKFSPQFAVNDDAAKNWRVALQSGAKSKTDKPMKVQSGDEHYFKLIVNSEGVYKIDKNLLSSAGISIPQNEIPTIKIYGSGGKELSETVSDGLKNEMIEQPIIVKTNGGKLDAIYFYGAAANGFQYAGGEFEHYLNHYSVNNSYIMTWGGGDGLRASELQPPAQAAENFPQTYVERIFFEEELMNAYEGGSGRDWLGGGFFPMNFENKTPDIDRSGEIKYKFAFAHRSPYAGTFVIYENGNKIGEAEIGGDTGNYVDGKRIYPILTASADNVAQDEKSRLRIDYEYSGSGVPSPYFDYYEIHYPRYFKAINEEIGFFSDRETDGATEYQISGFNGDIYGFEVGDPARPHLLKNQATSAGVFKFKIQLNENDPKRFFISSKTREPDIEKIEFGNLRSEPKNAEMIVVTHPDLEESANKYKEYRRAQSGVSVAVVRTDHIYNEYASGVPDPTAIRDFLAQALENWDVKPYYVLLWGDGHYDYKNIITNTKNYVPPYESIEKDSKFDVLVSYTTDDYYSRLRGDDRAPDVSIGRITVKSESEGDWMVDKIDLYENSSSIDAWRARVVLVADDSWKTDPPYDGDDHTEANEDISRYYLPQDLQQEKIYMVEYPIENIPGGKRKPRCTEDLLNSVNTRGAVLLNWIGHGNPRVWAHEEILERSATIPQMTNLDKLFFLTAATCDFGRFDMVDVESGAELLLESDKGGAIGVFSSARVVFASGNEAITKKFFSCLFERGESGEYPTVGETMYSVKQIYTGTNDEKFYLLGDPALRLILPKYEARIDSINGKYAGDDQNPVSLAALTEVSIKGTILIDGEEAHGFNGSAAVAMLDGDSKIVAIDFDGSKHNIVKHGGALNRGACEIENGKFETSFIIPKDISFSDERGRIYVYAYSQDSSMFAKGSSRNLFIDGISDNPIYDPNGPEIAIFMDSRDFSPGDIVRKNPLLIVELSDESGINASGVGIGHRIEAWIDGSMNSIDLTDKFETSPESGKSGSARQILYNLEPGTHSIKVRAWDVYNNYSLAESYFRILPEGRVIIDDIRAYPNPATGDGATFRFKHNASPPFKAKIDIYNSIGTRVYSAEEIISTSYLGEIVWNCRQTTGVSLPTGAYYFSITIYSDDGSVARGSGAAAIVK